MCGDLNVEKHHIFFGTAKRAISDKEGCWLWLCPEHHRGNSGVHKNFDKSRELQAKCEEAWIKYNNSSKEEFLKKFGRNYL